MADDDSLSDRIHFRGADADLKLEAGDERRARLSLSQLGAVIDELPDPAVAADIDLGLSRDFFKAMHRDEVERNGCDAGDHGDCEFCAEDATESAQKEAAAAAYAAENAHLREELAALRDVLRGPDGNLLSMLRIGNLEAIKFEAELLFRLQREVVKIEAASGLAAADCRQVIEERIANSTPAVRVELDRLLEAHGG